LGRTEVWSNRQSLRGDHSMSSLMSEAIKTICQLYLRAMQAIAEERQHRTAIEVRAREST
jgi:hypothetical protein